MTKLAAWHTLARAQRVDLQRFTTCQWRKTARLLAFWPRFSLIGQNDDRRNPVFTGSDEGGGAYSVRWRGQKLRQLAVAVFHERCQ